MYLIYYYILCLPLPNCIPVTNYPAKPRCLFSLTVLSLVANSGTYLIRTIE